MNRDQIAEVIGRHLAIHVSRNRMPHMSGDPRMRLPDHVLEDFDLACREAADAIMALDGWQTIDSAPMKRLIIGTDGSVVQPIRRLEPDVIYCPQPTSIDLWTHWRPFPSPPNPPVSPPPYHRIAPQPPGDAGRPVAPTAEEG